MILRGLQSNFVSLHSKRNHLSRTIFPREKTSNFSNHDSLNYVRQGRAGLFLTTTTTTAAMIDVTCDCVVKEYIKVAKHFRWSRDDK